MGYPLFLLSLPLQKKRIMIRPMTVSDVSEIVAIYAHYVNNTVVTFDTEVPSETEMCQRLCPIMEHYPAWVYVEDGKIAGYCYAHEWKTKKSLSLHR